MTGQPVGSGMVYRMVVVLAWGIVGVGCTDNSAPPTPRSAGAAQARRQAITHWVEQLKSSTVAEQRQALVALGHYQDRSAPYVVPIARFLESPSDSLGTSAAWALAQIGPASYPLLAKALHHGSAAVRRRAAYSLGAAGSRSAAAVPELRKLSESDPAVEVRRISQWALDQITQRQMIADKNLFLMSGLGDPDVNVRLEAVRRLGATHPASPESTRQLIRLLGDSAEAIRNAAVEALVETGSPAVPALTEALNHRRRLVRVGAMGALARIDRSF